MFGLENSNRYFEVRLIITIVPSPSLVLQRLVPCHSAIDRHLHTLAVFERTLLKTSIMEDQRRR